MEYLFNKFLSPVWNQLINVIEENYVTPDNINSVMMFAMYVHNKISFYRDQMGLHNRKIIVYQSEPLIEGEHWHPIERIIENLEGADEVWDYDLQNISVLKKYGINAKFRPPAYSNRLKTIATVENPDIDILFYGSYSEYRCKKIQQIFSDMVVTDENLDFLINTNFVWLYNITDKKLDDYISRSKLILNIKPFEHTTRQQQVRIFHPMINNKCVLSEKCDINYFGDNIHEFSDNDDFHKKLLHLLTEDRWKIDQNKIAYPGWIGDTNHKSKIAIFYHIEQTGNWHNIVLNQIATLQQSSLYDNADYIHVGLNGNEHLPFSLVKLNRTKYNSNTNGAVETLLDMQHFAAANPDYRILFLHNSAPESWRKYLEHYNVWNWRHCNKMLLQGYDCVGAEWNGERFIGDIWWTKAEYFSSLELPQSLNSKSPNVFNFKSIGKDTTVEIDQKEYLEY